MRTVAFTEGRYAFDRQSQPGVGIGPSSPTRRSFEESHVIELPHMRELSLQGESCREGSYPSLNGLDHRLATRFVSGTTRNSVSPRPIVRRAMPVARMIVPTP